MNRLYRLVWGVIALGLLAGTVSAKDAEEALGLDTSAAKEEAPKSESACDKCGKDDKCCNNSYHVIDFEATFFRLHGSELFPSFNGDDVFGYEFGPRVTVGYVAGNGLGVRGRWWSYDHSNTADNGQVFDIETFIIDVELFKEIELTCSTGLEWSAGIRYNDFDLDDGIVAATVFEFSAPGIVVGAKITQQLCTGALYASFRHAWLMDNDERNGAVAFYDVTRTITEGALGYEYARCLANGSILTLHGGVEMQNWTGYYANTSTGGGSPTDIGFGGLVAGVEWKY